MLVSIDHIFDHNFNIKSHTRKHIVFDTGSAFQKSSSTFPQIKKIQKSYREFRNPYNLKCENYRTRPLIKAAENLAKNPKNPRTFFSE